MKHLRTLYISFFLLKNCYLFIYVLIFLLYTLSKTMHLFPIMLALRFHVAIFTNSYLFIYLLNYFIHMHLYIFFMINCVA